MYKRQDKTYSMVTSKRLEDGSILQVVSDVTHLKAQEKDLKRVYDAIENIPNGAMIWNNKNELVFANKVARDVQAEVGFKLEKGLKREALVKNSIEKKCIVSCFNPLVLLKIKFKKPEIILGYLYNQNVPFHSWHNFVWINRVKPDNLHIHFSLLNSWVVSWARKKNLKINSYTINSRKTYKLANVDGVFTLSLIHI